MKVVAERNRALIEIPEIPAQDLKIKKNETLASGSYSDVFLYSWRSRDVAVKKLRLKPESDQMKELKMETSLSMSLLHPNIVKVFGSTKFADGMLGIVMEYADKGDLSRKNMDLLSLDQKIRVSFDICSALEFLHSRRVAHRDLKPENILLFGTRPVPKITDFGTSKVIQTMIQTTAMAGTPKYSAPETFERGNIFGVRVDIYSLAIVLYELFSGKNAFEGYEMMQILRAIDRNDRPEFPDDFPSGLQKLVEFGWDEDPNQRPTLDEFMDGLRQMASFDLDGEKKTFYARNQVKESNWTVNKLKEESGSIFHPLISMKWPDKVETCESKILRQNMLKAMKDESNTSRLKTMITENVFTAMGVVPRHIFFEPTRDGVSIYEGTKLSYIHNKPMPATKYSNESSPEIIGVQLSLVKVIGKSLTNED